MSKDDELVLCVCRRECEMMLDKDRGTGEFNTIPTGFIPFGHGDLSKLLRRGVFHTRGVCEKDPSLKQIIPYVTLADNLGNVLVYDRMKQSGEQRLVGKSSLGVGGHINQDAFNHPTLTSLFFSEVDREMREEINLTAASRSDPSVLGLINNEDDDVGSVHLGVLVLIRVWGAVVASAEAAIGSPRFIPLSDARTQRATFERWSQIVLDSVDLIQILD